MFAVPLSAPLSYNIICFLFGLNTTIAAAVQGDIIKASSHIEQLAWICAGFQLSSLTVVFSMGCLHNGFDMTWMFTITVAFFDIGSVLCGAAPDIATLIIGCVIAGAGGIDIYLGSLNFLTAPTDERGICTTIFGFLWGVRLVLGPVVRGTFGVSPATWH